MSIENELKKEHAKLTRNIAEWQQKIDAIECLMKQYGIYQSPSSKSLDEIIERCIQRNGGTATYEQIYSCITSGNVSIQKNKVSSALTGNKKLSYDKWKKEWRIVINDNHHEPLDLAPPHEPQKQAG